MAKYRFKRLDEYDASEINGVHDIPVTWSIDMGIYMGADIPDEYNYNCDNNRGFGMSGWWFKANEYVKKEAVINNIVIENTSEEHGKRIINHFKSFGIIQLIFGLLCSMKIKSSSTYISHSASSQLPFSNLHLHPSYFFKSPLDICSNLFIFP
jgi:hypothetical protein